MDNPTSIADRSRPLAARVVPWVVALLALGVAATGAWHYAALDLTLSHYDARGHLIVARRMFDSLTPGWRQIGAVWLPLPHVIDLPAVWSDWAYRTGYLVVLVSMTAVATGLFALARFLLRTTGSVEAAIIGPALIITNPNVLYLTSTPMTEPLLFGLSLVSLALAERWVRTDRHRDLTWLSVSLTALTWTRYEGWLIAGSLAAAVFAVTVRTRGWRSVTPSIAIALAVGAFLVLGWATTGSWFTTSGFFAPDNGAAGKLVASLQQVHHGMIQLGGLLVVAGGLAGMAACAWLAASRGSRAYLALSLMAAAVLPVYAFFQGHPYRIRYMVPLVVATAVLTAVAVGTLPRRLRWVAAALLAAGSWYTQPLFDPQAPMVLEAQWERPYRQARQAVTAYLVRAHDGTPVLASMGSLGHYMQETAESGFPLRTFLHEGNGDLWKAALAAPGRHVRWVLVEERAEGGDLLFSRATADPTYLSAFDRVAEGGGMALYRRR